MDARKFDFEVEKWGKTQQKQKKTLFLNHDWRQKMILKSNWGKNGKKFKKKKKCPKN